MRCFLVGFAFSHSRVCQACRLPGLDEQSADSGEIQRTRERRRKECMAVLKKNLKEFNQFCLNMQQSGLSETFDACTVAHFAELLRKLNASEADSCYVAHRLAEIVWYFAEQACKEDVEKKHREENRRQKTLLGSEGMSNNTARQEQLGPNAASESSGHGTDDKQSDMEASVNRFFADRKQAMALTLRQLLLSRCTHGVNIHHDMQTMVGKKVLELATWNRLPEKNPYQGHALLMDAIHYKQQSNKLATRYKCICLALISLRLLLGWMTILLTAVSLSSSQDSQTEGTFPPNASLSSAGDNGMLLDGEEIQNPFANALFVLTFATSLVLGIESFLNPKMLWQLFRTHACQLDTMMWHYRTRTGSFLILRHPGRTSPEHEFDRELTQWRNSVVVAAESVGSGFFPPRPKRDSTDQDMAADSSKADEGQLASQAEETKECVDIANKPCRQTCWYVWQLVWPKKEKLEPKELEGKSVEAADHGSEKGRQTLAVWPKRNTLLRDGLARSASCRMDGSLDWSIDEAPVTGDCYLTFRLHTRMEFYKKRLPSYRRMHTFFRTLLICLTLASTLISYMGLERWLVVVVALSGYVLTWAQTKDFKAKADPFLGTVGVCLAFWVGNTGSIWRGIIWFTLGPCEACTATE